MAEGEWVDELKKQFQDDFDNGEVRCPMCDGSDLIAGAVTLKVGNMTDKRLTAYCNTKCGNCGNEFQAYSKVKINTK